MNYDRQGTKQTFFWSHIHTYIHINIHTDGTKRLTLLRIRAQGNYGRVHDTGIIIPS